MSYQKGRTVYADINRVTSTEIETLLIHDIPVYQLTDEEGDQFAFTGDLATLKVYAKDNNLTIKRLRLP